ncbi:MAG TPA: type III PLP-dependent enzyme [bacterium]|nr:type III PLP-dependent enzyme [bacterium]HOL35323.1 type III PLP-dependent enzyme [bacterium]HPP09152.1 type III PLP-dependent enzyme [bacterium]
MNRTMRLNEKMIKGLVKKYGTPLFLIYSSRLMERVKLFRELLPRIEPFYAVKANSHPSILKFFLKNGLGFDVASKNEIETVLKLGGNPEKMIFANTVKSPESLKFAQKSRVLLMTFDSEYELTKIARFCPDAGVIVRIKVPNVGSVVELSLKFGVEPADAVPLLIKAYKMGLKPVGVSFHVGSQCMEVSNFVEALEISSIIFHDALLKKIPLEILDIGGGFPIIHSDSEHDIFPQMAERISTEIDRLFDKNIKIIAEPGRFLVGPACILVTRVIGKSIRNNKHWYYLDDGVYGCLSGIVYDHCKYQYRVFKKGPTQISTLAGPTCDSFDVISISEELPELEFGDIVYVENIGAYSLASATHFNSIPPAKTIFINTGG